MPRTHSGHSGDRSGRVSAPLNEIVAPLRIVAKRFAPALAEIDAAGPDAGAVALLGYFVKELTWVGLLMSPQNGRRRDILLETSGQQDQDALVRPVRSPSLFGILAALSFSDRSGSAHLSSVSNREGPGDPRDDISCNGVIAGITLFAHETASDLGELSPDDIGVAAETARQLHTPLLQARALGLLRRAVEGPS